MYHLNHSKLDEITLYLNVSFTFMHLSMFSIIYVSVVSLYIFKNSVVKSFVFSTEQYRIDVMCEMYNIPFSNIVQSSTMCTHKYILRKYNYNSFNGRQN